MKIGNVCIAVVALLAGAAAGYCVGRYVTPSSAPAEVRDEKPRHSQRAGVGNDAEKKILRERVAAQDARIRELETQGRPEEGPGEKQPATAAREGTRPPRRDFRAEMERLRVEEPERYAQITNRMAQGVTGSDAAVRAMHSLSLIEIICVAAGIAVVLMLPRIHQERNNDHETER